MLKKGDRVRVLRDEECPEFVGEQGEVISINFGWARVWVDGDPMPANYLLEDLELIP